MIVHAMQQYSKNHKFEFLKQKHFFLILGGWLEQKFSFQPEQHICNYFGDGVGGWTEQNYIFLLNFISWWWGWWMV